LAQGIVHGKNAPSVMGSRSRADETAEAHMSLLSELRWSRDVERQAGVSRVEAARLRAVRAWHQPEQEG
jgi:hypothetical protein